MHIDPIRAAYEAVPTAQPDPLFQLVLPYARERDRFNAVEDATDEQTALDIIPLERFRGCLRDNPPAPTTVNGAAAVLRFLAQDLEDGDIVDFHAPGHRCGARLPSQALGEPAGRSHAATRELTGVDVAPSLLRMRRIEE